MSTKIFSKPTAKGLFHFGVWHVAAPYSLEYLVCLGLTAIVNGTLFNGRLGTFSAALGVMAAGVLARYFLRPRPARQPQLQLAAMPSMDLAALLSRASQEAHTANVADTLAPSPYL